MIDWPLKETAANLPIEGGNNAKPNQGHRTIKMAYPKHDECNPTGRDPGWWRKCRAAGHNPYVSEVEVVTKEKTYEEREDGSKELTGEREVVTVVPNLNVTQIVQEEWVDSGRSVEKAINRGYVLLTDLGYPRLCELSGCFREAKVIGPYGAYCSNTHNKAVGVERENTVIEIYDEKRKKQQYGVVASAR